MADVLDQSQTDGDTWQGSLHSVRRRSQSFTTGVGVENVSQVILYWERVGNDLDAYVDIYLSDTGANDDKPTGASLGTSTVVNGIGTGSPAEVTFDFATPVTVSAETKYCAVAKYTDGDASNYIKYYTAGSDPYANGQSFYSNDEGSTWATESRDQYFKTYYDDTGGATRYDQAETDIATLNETLYKSAGLHITITE